MMKKNILIVEDDQLLREVLTEIFQDDGWSTFSANHGLEALEILKNEKFDVILSDINMPQMDGLKFLKQLAAEQNTTPLIFLSGYRDIEKMKAAWQYCVFDFVDKPFDAKNLLYLCENAYIFGREYVSIARKRFERISKNQKTA